MENSKTQIIQELEKTMKGLRKNRELEMKDAQNERRRLEKKLASLRERIALEVGDASDIDGASRASSVDLASSSERSPSRSRRPSSAIDRQNAKRTRQELQRQLTTTQEVRLGHVYLTSIQALSQSEITLQERDVEIHSLKASQSVLLKELNALRKYESTFPDSDLTLCIEMSPTRMN